MYKHFIGVKKNRKIWEQTFIANFFDIHTVQNMYVQINLLNNDLGKKYF